MGFFESSEYEAQHAPATASLQFDNLKGRLRRGINPA
jgi:hypothetical protein